MGSAKELIQELENNLKTNTRYRVLKLIDKKSVVTIQVFGVTPGSSRAQLAQWISPKFAARVI